jgi:tRNA nucleotidyltransferase (CCA-adding enzyme)
MEAAPSRMFATLRRCGALAALLPEVDVLFGIPQPPRHHAEIDTGVHVLQALDYAARRAFPLPVRYAVLAHDFGKAGSPQSGWPTHHGHEGSSVRRAEHLSKRLRVPVDCRDAARLAARWHGIVHRAHELRAATWLDLLTAADALRRPDRLTQLLQACESDALSRPGAPPVYAPAGLAGEALAVVKSVDAGAIAVEVVARGAKHGAPPGTDAIAKAVRSARLRALAAWRRGRD